MELTEQEIEMFEKAEEIQEEMRAFVQNQRDTHNYNYLIVPVFVFNDYGVCQKCGKHLHSKFCPEDGGEAPPTREGHLSFCGLSDFDRDHYRYVYLPTSDHLAEMVTDSATSAVSVAERFGNFCASLRKITFNAFASRRQLWLLFVMKEKYGKMWDGEAWYNA
jgi:hypothetical protein